MNSNNLDDNNDENNKKWLYSLFALVLLIPLCLPLFVWIFRDRCGSNDDNNNRDDGSTQNAEDYDDQISFLDEGSAAGDTDISREC